MTMRTALRALRRNKLRSVLTMLGIIIGVAAVISMVSIGQGADAGVQRQIQSLGNHAEGLDGAVSGQIVSSPPSQRLRLAIELSGLLHYGTKGIAIDSLRALAKTEQMEKSVRVAERQYSKKMSELNRGFEVSAQAVRFHRISLVSRLHIYNVCLVTKYD
jgi:ABC-type antimicrobial peptide transport system permease subunit